MNYNQYGGRQQPGGFFQQMGQMGLQQQRRTIGNSMNQNRAGGWPTPQLYQQTPVRNQNQAGNRNEGVQARLGDVVRSPATPLVRNQANKPVLTRPGQEKRPTPPAEVKISQPNEKEQREAPKSDDRSSGRPALVTAPAGKSTVKAPDSKPEPITAPGKKVPITAPGAKPAPITAPKPVPITAPKPAPITAPKPAPITAPSSKPAPITAPKPAMVSTPKPAPTTAPGNKPTPVGGQSNQGASRSTPAAKQIGTVGGRQTGNNNQAGDGQASNHGSNQGANNQPENKRGFNNQTGGRQNSNNPYANRQDFNNQPGNRQNLNNQQGNRQNFNNTGNRQDSNNQPGNRRAPNNVSTTNSGSGHWQTQAQGNAAAKKTENTEDSSRPTPLMEKPMLNNPANDRNGPNPNQKGRHSRFDNQRDSDNQQKNRETRNNERQPENRDSAEVKPSPVIAGRLGPREGEESPNKYAKNNNEQRVKPAQGRGGNSNQWNEDGKKSGYNPRSKPRPGQQGNRDQNDGGRDYRREGGRGRGGYTQDKFWERLNEIRGEQYELEPLDMSEKKFNAQARLFAGSLSRDTTLEEITEMFSKYGELGQVYHNKEGAYAFVNFDYRANAEKAVRELHGTQSHGRNLMVRFAAITTGVRVKNLSTTVTNELLYKAFSVFGAVELCRVIVDDRGKPTGDGIIIFNEKKPAVMAYKKCQEESYFLTSQLRPVIVEPWETRDDEEGFPESSIQKNENYRKDRRVGPRFAELGSVESDYGKRWKQLFDIYKEKKLALENDLKAEMEALEVKMQLVVHQQETEKLRRELAQREQEALQLQRGLGSFGEQIRPTQLTAASDEYSGYGGQQQGLKRPHDYYDQQQGRDYYGEYYQQQNNNPYGSSGPAAAYDQPQRQPPQQQQGGYGGVSVSGVSGAAYDRVDPVPAPVNAESTFAPEVVGDVAKSEPPSRPDRMSRPFDPPAADAYASVPAGQQQTIETYTRQAEPYTPRGQGQQREYFEAGHKRGRY